MREVPLMLIIFTQKKFNYLQHIHSSSDNAAKKWKKQNKRNQVRNKKNYLYTYIPILVHTYEVFPKNQRKRPNKI